MGTERNKSLPYTMPSHSLPCLINSLPHYKVATICTYCKQLELGDGVVSLMLSAISFKGFHDCSRNDRVCDDTIVTFGGISSIPIACGLTYRLD